MKIQWPGNLSSEDFLNEFWQKKPLLLKNAIPDLNDLVSADQIAGLACEEDVESRIISDKDFQDWHLIHGPFSEDIFSTLPDSHWTLLVQDVDKHLPETQVFMSCFDFIPKWRIDDLMVSYATDQGSVGPHTDSYDVFLIQLQGERLWKISEEKQPTSALLADNDVKILQHFKASKEWLVKPGDILYLPPNVAHWGIAQGECLTGSVGFISPTLNELFNYWSDDLISNLKSDRYQDPDLSPAKEGALIDDFTISKIQDLIQENINASSNRLKTWFGEMMTQPKENLLTSHTDDLDQDQFIQALRTANLYKHPYVRTFYSVLDNQDILLFAGGEHFQLSHKAGNEYAVFVRYFCESTSSLPLDVNFIDNKTIPTSCQVTLSDCLYWLYQRGFVFLEQ